MTCWRYLQMRRQYKKSALRSHPDKNPDDPAASQKFQAITNAYEVLSDPDKRAFYDQHGTDPSSRGGGGGGGGDYFDPSDMFGQFFSGGGGGPEFSSDRRRGGPSKPTQPRPTRVNYELSLEDAFIGKRVSMMVERDRVCKGCNGSGVRSGAKPMNCTTCAGQGWRWVKMMLAPGFVQRVQEPCPTCEGTGKIVKDSHKCKKCHGKKTTKEKKKLTLDIPAGTFSGERAVFSGEGDEVPGAPPGDIEFSFQVTPHPAFKILPNSPHLYVTASITLSESLLGFTRVLLNHLDGSEVKVHAEKGKIMIRHGEVFKLVGEGMKRPVNKGGDGDLFVKFDVELPSLAWAQQVDRQALTVTLPPRRNNDIEMSLEGFHTLEKASPLEAARHPANANPTQPSQQQGRQSNGASGSGRRQYDSDEESEGVHAQCAQQ